MLTPEPGTIVGGKYRILHALGEGGMGTVYAAENLLTLKQSAIKWLHPRLVAVQEASQRLLYEARATARIRHRNVVDIYDVVLEGDSVFLVMELLLGEQLSTFLAREQSAVHEVINLFLPAMRGVAAAHAAGVVHRDVKPENIFLARESGSLEPVPKVIDFGISRIFEADGARLTLSGVTMGTPRYVSYEQLRGLRDVDERCDVYAFGVMLYEAVVGQPPYRASTFGEQAISFVTTEPSAPRALRSELPERLDALIVSAIAKERTQRPASMLALIAALEPFSRASAYDRPMPAHRLRITVPPALVNETGTTVSLIPTLVPSELSPAIHERRNVPAAPFGRLRRTRSLLVAMLGVSLAAALFVSTTRRIRRIEDRAKPPASAKEPPAREHSEPRLSLEGTDRPISRPDVFLAGPNPVTTVRDETSPVERIIHHAEHARGRNDMDASDTFSKRRGRSRLVTARSAPSTVTSLEQTEAGHAPVRENKNLLSDAAQDKSTDPSRAVGEAALKPHESNKDEVHRAGGLQRKEF